MWLAAAGQLVRTGSHRPPDRQGPTAQAIVAATAVVEAEPRSRHPLPGRLAGLAVRTAAAVVVAGSE